MIFVVVLIILILLFIPIPIKLTFTYINNVAKLKVYFKEFNLTEMSKKPKKNKAPKRDFKKYITKEKILAFHEKFKKVQKIHSLDIVSEFGLGDPAETAILFGVISSSNFLIYEALNYIINIKNFSIRFVPDTNRKIFNNKTTSIIFFSFAKIIYIILLFVYIFFAKSKQSNLKEELKCKPTQ